MPTRYERSTCSFCRTPDTLHIHRTGDALVLYCSTCGYEHTEKRSWPREVVEKALPVRRVLKRKRAVNW